MKFTIRDDKIHRHRPPGGGWRYREMATNWEAPNPLGDSFDVTVQKIAEHRRANPGYRLPHDLDSVRQALIDQTVSHIISRHPGLVKEWLVALDDEAQKKTGPLSAPQQPVSRRHAPTATPRGSRLARVMALVNGARTLARWLGDGSEPVSQDIAESRANRCASCPLNVRGDWFDRVTGSIADMVREEVTAKSAMDLRVKKESELGTCDACGCNLRLKVWVPMDVILPRMTDEALSRLDGKCWVLEESEK